MAAIYVGNLHAEVTEVLLLHMFSSAGKVQSVHICRDRKRGSSRGYAYVNFQRRADAERALDMFNLKLLLGKPMRIMWSNYETRVRISKRGNIFLKNLEPSIDKLALSDTFSIFGRIMSCKVVSKDSGSPGYGFIQFETEESAESAIELLNGKLLNNYQVTIEHFKSHKQCQAELHKKWEEERMQEHESTYLCIKNLDESIDDKDLYLAFSNFGTITKTKVIMMNGHSLGFGFVCFSSAKEAMIARRNMNGRMWGNKPLHIGVAISGAERQAQLALQPMQPPSLSDNTISEVETCLNSVPAVQPVQSVDIVPVKTAPSLNSIPAPAPTLDTVSDTETSPAVDLNSAEVQSAHIPETSQAPEVDESLSSTTSSTEMQLDTKDKPISQPRKKLTINMLKSVRADEQILMAYDYMLPLIEEIHPVFADKLTWKLLEEKTNFEIVNMMEDPEKLRAKVDELVNLLIKKYGALKEDALKSIFSINRSKKRRKKGKNKRLI